MNHTAAQCVCRKPQSDELDGVITILRHYTANDNQVFEDDREIGTTAIRRQHTVLFAHRMFPERFAGVAVQALKLATKSENKDVACAWVANHAGPTNALGGCIRQINVVNALPNERASLGIDANCLFAFFSGLRLISANHEYFAIHDNRS